MPHNPSEYSSRKTRTRRSGSSAKNRPEPPAALLAPIDPAWPGTRASQAPPTGSDEPALPAGPTPARRPTWRAWLLFALAFLLLHVFVGELLGYGFGLYAPIPALTFIVLPMNALMAEFLYWGFVLGAAVLAGFTAKSPLLVRATVLVVYAAALLTSGLVGTRAGVELFYTLLQFFPLPALFFIFGGRRWGWDASRLFGLVLMFWDHWRGVYGSFPSLIVIAAGGRDLPPTPAFHFYEDFFIKFLWDLSYVVLGLFFFFHAVPGLHKPFRWGRTLESVLRPMGAWVRRRPVVDLAWGALFFVLNIIGIFGLVLLLSLIPKSGAGDSSKVFDMILLDQVFLLSIMAAVSEELFFRAILQSGLHRLFGGGRLAFVAAWLIQALSFALVHSGYASFSHFVFAFAFALFMGIVYRYFGILAVMLVHLEMDLVAFSDSYLDTHPGSSVGLLPPLLFFGSFLFGTIVIVWELLSYYERRKRERRATCQGEAIGT